MKSKPNFSALKPLFVAITLFFVFSGPLCAYDLVLEGVYEAALDLPRIFFLLKRTPDGDPILYEGYFELNWAFLDTGASGLLLSKETTDLMEIAIEPNAVYVDVGVGGEEYFDVSESLYVGTAGFEVEDPYDTEVYTIFGPWRFQVKQYTVVFPEEPLDILGIPPMAGQTIVFHPGATNELEYFSADIREPNDTGIPEVDFQVPVRFDKYITPDNSSNVGPLPGLGYNPMIDNITVDYNSQSSTGNWLLDTGASLSLISVAQGVEFGLVHEDGTPIGTPDFSIPIGGIGGTLEIPGFELDSMAIPTLSGYNLVYDKPRLGVLDIGVYDETTGQYKMLDGVFGSNFLCGSAKLVDGWPVELSGTIFEYLVLDMRGGFLGFDLFDEYKSMLPICGTEDLESPLGDLNNDCRVNIDDLTILTNVWLSDNCDDPNNTCYEFDLNDDGFITMGDFSVLSENWTVTSFMSYCGDVDNPWPLGDLNRDCSLDLFDLLIVAEEWLGQCDWLNWKCRGGDLNDDGVVNLVDFSIMSSRW